MSDILCVTNRELCNEDFILRVEKIASAHPAGIILREKNMCEEEYKELASRVWKICQRYHTKLILHNFVRVSLELKCTAIHLPLPILYGLSDKEKIVFTTLGASCHSVEEAIEAEKLGCTYITAGHIFDTDCKRGLPGRALSFLKNMCQAVKIPVYAIGGISADNIDQVRESGATGACVMSGTMLCKDVQEYLSALKGE